MESYFDLLEGRGCATELLTSAYCNMDCEYCYIPKNDQMKEMHAEVVEHLKDPEKYISILKRTYGEHLEYMSFWGTEPTLILRYISPNIEKYLRAFPKLREFSFSTNFLSHSTSVHAFIFSVENAMENMSREGISTDERFGQRRRGHESKIMISTQISLDGPEEITDVSRKPGATKKIVENFINYVEFVKTAKMNHVTVEARFKPTISIEHIKSMSEDETMMARYFKFFNDIYDEFDKRKQDLNGKMSLRIAGSGTLMVPGKYTSEDGRIFAKYLEKQKEFGAKLVEDPTYEHYKFFPSEYLNRFENFMMVHNEGTVSNATCSGGDTNFAIDSGGELHICHRSFYMNDERYLKAIARDNDTENWDVSLFEDGKISNIQKNYIVNIDDHSERDRFMTVMRGFHDYRELRESYVYGIIKWMAAEGQANERFLKDDAFAQLFAKYIVFVFGCSIENILNTTSIHFTPLSIIRIFGNGAFEVILNEYLSNTTRNTKED